MCLTVASAAVFASGCGGPAAGAAPLPQNTTTTPPAAIPVVRSTPMVTETPSELSEVPHVPASSAVTLPDEPSGEAIYHEAKAGDTPAKVARQYQTTTEKLLRHNGLDSSAELEPGQLLAIPP